jgi:hypothetical protein
MSKTISVYSVKNLLTGRFIYRHDTDKARAGRLAVAAQNNNPAGDYQVRRTSVPNPEYVAVS